MVNIYWLCRLIVVTVFLLIPTLSYADKYFRGDCNSTGTGYSGDGTSWACAESAGATGAYLKTADLGDMTTGAGSYTWQRGSTYWFVGSDINYGNFGFRNSSGTATDYVTIKRATDTDCSAQTGWDAVTAGEKAKQALFQYASTRNFSYAVIDGVTGSNETGYGFKFVFQTAYVTLLTGLIQLPSGYTHSHWRIQNLELSSFAQGETWNCYDGETYICQDGIRIVSGDDIIIDNIYSHHVAMCAYIGWTTNVEFKNSHCKYNWFDNDHHNPMMPITGSNGLLIENNIFQDGEGTTCIGTPVAGDDNITTQNITIRNNIFYDSVDAPAFVGGWGQADEGTISSWDPGQDIVTNWKIYNNTFYLHRSGAWIDFDSVLENNGVEVKNNIWWCDQGVACSAATNRGDLTLSNNGFYGNTASVNETNKITLTSTRPWVATGTDWSLVAGGGAVDVGADLSGSWADAVDRAGVTRPQGAAWDIGAYEYLDTAPAAAHFSGSGSFNMR